MAPDEDENIYSEVELRPPSEGGGEEGIWFLLLRHCEERFVRRGNLIHLFRHCEERSDVAILFSKFF